MWADRADAAAPNVATSFPTVGPVERALALRSLPLFHALRSRQLAMLAQHTREFAAPRGSVLHRSGERVRTIYLLAEGRVNRRRGEHDLPPLEPPEAIGLLEVLADLPARVSAIADGDVSGLAIEGAALLDVLEDDFSLLLHLHTALGREVAARQTELGCYVPPATVASAAPLPALPESLDLVHWLLALQRAPELRGLGVGVLAALLRDRVEVRLAAGEALFTPDVDARRFFVLVDGEVECTPPHGAASFRARAGDVLGREAALSGTAYQFSAVAAAPVAAIGIDAQLFWDVAEDHFHVARSALALCARRLLWLDERGAGAAPPGGDTEALAQRQEGL